MPFPVEAAAEVGQGIIKDVTGIFQRRKGNKLLKSLQYPTETLPDEYAQNQNLATTMAATGMPSEQYNLAMKNIQQQQIAALRRANDRRAGLIAIPSIQAAGNNATLALDAENAQERIANQRNLINVNNQVAGVKRDLFDKNIRDKYMRDYQYAQSLLGVGGQNLTSGADNTLTGILKLLNKNNTSSGVGLDGTGGY